MNQSIQHWVNELIYEVMDLPMNIFIAYQQTSVGVSGPPQGVPGRLLQPPRGSIGNSQGCRIFQEIPISYDIFLEI